MASVLLLKGLGGCSQGFFVYWEESRKESQRNLANPNVLNRKEIFIMMYPFMTLNDDTEITHSEMKPDGKVKVYIETPDEKYCFRHATCWLPAYKWEDIYHFSETDIAKFQEIIESTAHLILEFSQEGGFCNAANL